MKLLFCSGEGHFVGGGESIYASAFVVTDSYCYDELDFNEADPLEGREWGLNDDKAADPCKDVSPASFDYSRIGNDGLTIRAHIEQNHMVNTVNGQFGVLQLDKQGRAKSQYEFAPQGTADQNFAFVRALNAATFLKAKGVPSRGAITYTATFTPFELKAVGSTVPGVDPKKFWQFVGNEGTPASPGTLMGPFKPTNKNTVVLNSQCQPVTSHPGDPR